MARLVDDLLLLAGSDAGAWQMRFARLLPEEVCRRAYEQFLPLAAAADRRLVLRLPPAPAPEILGDEERLVQLLGVLLTNALEYAPPGSAVELALETHGAQAALLVQDHGPGIPDSEKPRVFDRFYRSERSRANRAHFGLGLAVAAELCRLHSGRLSVRDTPGEDAKPCGATFVLELPGAP